MYWLNKTQEETANFYTYRNFCWSCMEAAMKLNRRSVQTGHWGKQTTHRCASASFFLYIKLNIIIKFIIIIILNLI